MSLGGLEVSETPVGPAQGLLQLGLHQGLVGEGRVQIGCRVVEDPGSPTGWKVDIGPFPGWQEVPTW